MRKLFGMLGIALALTGGVWADDVEVLGEATSVSVVIDLVNETPGYQVVEYPFALLVDLVPEVSEVRVNDLPWANDSDTASVTWQSACGLKVLTHQPMENGTAVGYGFSITAEVWAAAAIFDSADRPLKELLPTTYDRVTSVTFAEGVTSICEGFFDGGNVTEVHYPSTLEDFGLNYLLPAEQAALTYDTNGFIITNGWILAYNDATASTVTIPEGIVGIGRGAFADMYDLESVQFPESLKYISAEAFAGDSYLDNVEIPDSVEVIGPGAFQDCSYIQTISFGNGLRKIGASAFAGCTQLASVSFAKGLEEIGAEAFAGDWRMQSVGLPVTVVSIGADAFTGCSSLTGLTIPTHGATMRTWLGGIAGQIRNVTIPKGETEIGVNMFSNCTALTTIEIPEGVTNVADGAFYGCSALQELGLPRTTQAVGARAFQGCSSLQAAVLPENVSTLGSAAFYGCSYLKDLTLSRVLTEISDYAFSGCSRLTSFVVPESVTRLGRNIMASSVTAIYYLGSAPSYDANVYADASSSLTSYVVNGTKGWDGRPQSRDLPASWPVTNNYARAISFWTSNAFDVTFDANGGLFLLGGTNTYACAQITYTPYALPPYEPTLGGAKFGGYWTERTGGTRVTSSTAVKLTKAHTLYAHWDVAPSMTVRFNANGGTVSPDSQVYTSGEPFGSFPVATREHYNFVGWYSAANGGKKAAISDEAPYADRELFAHWVPKIYEILFHSNNGSDLTASQPYTYGDTVTLAANRFSCTGCTFAGWSLQPGGKAVYADGKTFSEVSAVQDGAIHLYAVWAGRTYAVRFDSNGGYGQMESQTFVLGISQNLSTNVFTRPGYVFAGWATTPSGMVTYEDGALAVGLTERQNDTVDLFAVWERTGVSLAEALGGAVARVSIAGDADWIVDPETTQDGVASVCTAGLKPAAEGAQVATTLTAEIAGSGTGSFWWKVNCEEDYEGEWYDYAVFAIDGVEKARIAGDVDWTQVDWAISTTGAHTLSWTFYRDDFDEEDAEWLNCLWVDGLVWNRDISSYTVADLLNAPDLSFTSGGVAPWTADAVTNHDGAVGMRSGAISHSQETWIETTVTGRGELSFWWKVSGQVNGSRVYDYAKCELDGVLVARAGLVDWTNLVVAVSNDGPHTIRWTYLKNPSTNPEGDCAWLDEVAWTAAKELSVIVPAAISGKADIVIAPAWFVKYPNFVSCYGSNLSAAMLKPNGKRGPRGGPGYVWHDYVMGTDPTNPDDVFTAKIEMVGGKPTVRWTPALNGVDSSGACIKTGERVYRTLGATSLQGEWTEVNPGNEGDFRFFKVVVEMP